MNEARQLHESYLLGAILIESSYRNSRDAIEEVSKIVLPSSFADSGDQNNQHARIFEAMISCPEPPNEVVVAQEMDKKGTYKPGDAGYLCHLTSICPMSLDYPYYAKVAASHANAAVISMKKKPHRTGLRIEDGTNNH